MAAHPDDAKTCEHISELALKAGREIMRIYRGGIEVERKADESPVTQADRAGERIIIAGLTKLFPAVPIVAEEAISEGHAPGDLGNEFFLVDPLDGTKEFIKKRGDFTVNIALVRRGAPVIGAVYAPARGELYRGYGDIAEQLQVSSEAVPETLSRIKIRARAAKCCIVASRSHRTVETDEFIARFEECETVSVGSSLKFCLLANGQADIYPRFGRTMEWDTAAGDAILRAAGGSTIMIDGSPLLYGKRNQPDDVDFANPHFIAYGELPHD